MKAWSSFFGDYGPLPCNALVPYERFPCNHQELLTLTPSGGTLTGTLLKAQKTLLKAQKTKKRISDQGRAAVFSGDAGTGDMK